MPVALLNFRSLSAPEDVDVLRPPTTLSKPHTLHPPLSRFSPAENVDRIPQASPSDYASSATTQSERIPSRFRHLDLCRRTRVRDQNFRRSPIHQLPPDILGTVFEYVCLSRPKKAWQRPFSPTTLGSICAYWYHVAWSTSRVWTHLRLDYSFWRAAGRNRLVRLHVQNSRGLGLHLEVRNIPIADGRGGSMGILGGDVFDTLFIKHPHKPESLDFRVYVDTWLHHIGEISRLGGLINLRRLRIKDNRDMVPVPGTSLSICNLPSLSEVTLDGLGGPLMCPWTQVVDLTLSVIPSDDAFNAIWFCENLKTLRCVHLIHQDIWQPDTIPEHIVRYPYLEKIVWESTVPLSIAWNEALTHWFDLPSLRTIIFNVPITAVKQPTNILLNLPRSISSLTLNIDLCNTKEARTCIAKRLQNVKAANRDILRRILSTLPSLSTLTIQCEPSFDPDFIDMLTLEGTRTDLAPALRELVLVTDSPCSPEAFLSLLKVVNTRWSGGRSTFEKSLETVGLVVPTVQCIERWPRAFIDGMSVMVRQGLRVALHIKAEGTVDIDWSAPFLNSGVEQSYETYSLSE